MRALRRYLPEIDFDKPIPLTLLERIHLTELHNRAAVKQNEPSSLRAVAVAVPTTRWNEVGGVDRVRQLLEESVELPFRNPQVYRLIGIEPPRGILLYGPPGVGKTLLAKAAATESQANFISVKGPEVMSKWVGESEKAVRMIFKKARQASPSIVFIDEIDSIAPRRGLQTSSGVTERIVNQLLTSIDGLESLERVLVIAATNRPDIVDEALLRTGRFDRLLYVGPPDVAGRLEIFKVHTRRMPLTDDVDLNALAERADGYVGSDIAALCREAGLTAIRENLKATKVTRAHFDTAFQHVHGSVDPESLRFYEEFEKHLLRERPSRRREEPVEAIYR